MGGCRKNQKKSIYHLKLKILNKRVIRAGIHLPTHCGRLEHQEHVEHQELTLEHSSQFQNIENRP